MLSTGQGVLGHNCYAYCLNNPIGLTDDGGYAASGNNIYITADGNSGSMQPNGKRVYCFEYGEELQAIEAFKQGKDVYYRSVHLKGVAIPSLFDASYTILGEIHLHPHDLTGDHLPSKKTEKEEYLKHLLRHEYGHALHEKRIGIVKYVKHIGIPSVTHRDANNYYDQPWEMIAEILGGNYENDKGSYDSGAYESAMEYYYKIQYSN